MIQASSFLSNPIDLAQRNPGTGGFVTRTLDRTLQDNEMNIKMFDVQTGSLPDGWTLQADHSTNPGDRTMSAGGWRNRASQGVAGFEFMALE